MNTTTEDTVESKAKEIVDKFKKQLLTATPSLNRPSYQAKKCAIICVDEILKSNPTSPTEWHHNDMLAALHIESEKFWYSVKEKIKSL